jgi:hypothetical protein
VRILVTPSSPTTLHPFNSSSLSHHIALQHYLGMSSEPEQHKAVAPYVAVGNINDAVLNNLQGLIDLKLPFDGTGFDPSEAFHQESRNLVYDDVHKSWKFRPSRPKGHMPTFLYVKGMEKHINGVCDAFAPPGGDLRKGKSNRRWKVLRAPTNKFYLALVNSERGDPANQHQLAIIDIEPNPRSLQSKLDDVLGGLASKAQRVFNEQPDRRSLIGAVLADQTMLFVVFNRAGMLMSHLIDVDNYPVSFIRVVVGLLVADRTTLGYDNTMFYTRTDDAPIERFVVVSGRKYRILEKLHSEGVIRGRGTACLKVQDCEDETRILVSKDTWVFANAPILEATILGELETVDGISKLEAVDHLSVELLDGELMEDSTVLDVARLNLSTPVIDNRKHIRMLLSPFGSKLTDFRSLGELLKVIIDIAGRTS